SIINFYIKLSENMFVSLNILVVLFSFQGSILTLCRFLRQELIYHRFKLLSTDFLNIFPCLQFMTTEHITYFFQICVSYLATEINIAYKNNKFNSKIKKTSNSLLFC